MLHVKQIDYNTPGLLVLAPFILAYRHGEKAYYSTRCECRCRSIHFALAFLECIPVLNYVVAYLDKRVNYEPPLFKKIEIRDLAFYLSRLGVFPPFSPPDKCCYTLQEHKEYCDTYSKNRNEKCKQILGLSWEDLHNKGVFFDPSRGVPIDCKEEYQKFCETIFAQVNKISAQVLAEKNAAKAENKHFDFYERYRQLLKEKKLYESIKVSAPLQKYFEFRKKSLDLPQIIDSLQFEKSDTFCARMDQFFSSHQIETFFTSLIEDPNFPETVSSWDNHVSSPFVLMLRWLDAIPIDNFSDLAQTKNTCQETITQLQLAIGEGNILREEGIKTAIEQFRDFYQQFMQERLRAYVLSMADFQ